MGQRATAAEEKGLLGDVRHVRPGPPSPPPGDLDHTGWACSKDGEIVNGELRSKDDCAHFKHSQELKANDVWRMRVEV